MTTPIEKTQIGLGVLKAEAYDLIAERELLMQNASQIAEQLSNKIGEIKNFISVDSTQVNDNRSSHRNDAPTLAERENRE